MRVFSFDRTGVHLLGKVNPGDVRILTSFVGTFYYCNLERYHNAFVRWLDGGTLEYLLSTIVDKALIDGSSNGNSNIGSGGNSTESSNVSGQPISDESLIGDVVQTTNDSKSYQMADGSLLTTTVLKETLKHDYSEEDYHIQRFYSTKDDTIKKYETYLNIHKFKAYVNTGLTDILLKNSALTHFYVQYAPACTNLIIKNTGEYHHSVKTIGDDDTPLSFHESLINLDYPVKETLLQVLYLTGMPALKTCFIQIETLKTIDFGSNSPIQDLTLIDYNQVILNMPNVPNLRKFTLINNPSTVMNFTKNYYLDTIHLEKMQSLVTINLSPSATNLTVKNCQKIVELDLRNNTGISNLSLPNDRELIKVDVRYCAISLDSNAVYNLIDSLYNRYNLEVWGRLIISSIDIVNQWKDFAFSKGWYLSNDAVQPTLVLGMGSYPLAFHTTLIGLPAI